MATWVFWLLPSGEPHVFMLFFDSCAMGIRADKETMDRQPKSTLDMYAQQEGDITSMGA